MKSPIVVMGVSGSGKSTVGAALAQRLRVPFADADDFHPEANVAKMSAGHALNDEDRHPWLDAMKSVTISDGRLTVRNAAGATSNKICFIEITPQ